MANFAVPEHHSVAHFALGILLDRARLQCVGCDGRYQLTVSLVKDDVTLLQEMGVVQGACDSLEAAAQETDTQTIAPQAFEKELADLQKKVEAALAKARRPSTTEPSLASAC
ncbi:MAG: hypothetical protein ACR2QJ_01340 [Geminicoccaceae bacterium]